MTSLIWRLRKLFTMTNIPSPWPSPDVLEELVQKSSGYFIYASTLIKFVGDENYRPTERLAVALDGNNTDSANSLLCPKAVRTHSHPADGETQLILRGLHSVIRVPPSDFDFDGISSHHASFWEFLNNRSRSGTFYIGGLRRIDLACKALKWWREPGTNCYPIAQLNGRLISFIVSLPSSPKLLASNRNMHPGSIVPLFASIWENTDTSMTPMLSWLKTIRPSAPPDLIELWEDYQYMSCFERMFRGAVTANVTLRKISLSFKFVEVLVALVICPEDLSNLPLLLDITWVELRAIICGPHPNSTPRDKFPRGASWACRDLMFRYLAQVEHAHHQDFAIEHILLKIPFLIRLSPLCPELRRKLCSIVTLLTRSVRLDEDFYYHVDKWLDSFPDSERQAWSVRKPSPGAFVIDPTSEQKRLWECVKDWNEKPCILGLIALESPDKRDAAALSKFLRTVADRDPATSESFLPNLESLVL
ncbi:hypothetical protein C8R45DRAFT_1221465 [Mycena sanguinolenta]|nr:hypothetical protein C8R45DRAFT_1221465 [Mycena sanguinolenta]